MFVLFLFLIQLIHTTVIDNHNILIILGEIINNFAIKIEKNLRKRNQIKKKKSFGFGRKVLTLTLT